MLKFLCFLVAMLIILSIGCKKGADSSTPAPDTCSHKMLTSVKTTSQGEGLITYYPNGTIRRMGFDVVYFNNGQLMESIDPTDTVVLDSIGRVRYMKKAFDYDRGQRQTRYYFYDNQNRVVKTLTDVGNGIDYFSGLVYSNGDVISQYFSSSPGDTSRFNYTYYDTLCADHYLGMQYWAQIGQTENRHLLKDTKYGDDSTHYSYELDSNKRVLVRYRNYDNSGWYYSRAIDTNYFVYTCP